MVNALIIGRNVANLPSFEVKARSCPFRFVHLQFYARSGTWKNSVRLREVTPPTPASVELWLGGTVPETRSLASHFNELRGASSGVQLNGTGWIFPKNEDRSAAVERVGQQQVPSDFSGTLNKALVLFLMTWWNSKLLFETNLLCTWIINLKPGCKTFDFNSAPTSNKCSTVYETDLRWNPFKRSHDLIYIQR